jgi:hypothetical protein
MYHKECTAKYNCRSSKCKYAISSINKHRTTAWFLYSAYLKNAELGPLLYGCFYSTELLSNLHEYCTCSLSPFSSCHLHSITPCFINTYNPCYFKEKNIYIITYLINKYKPRLLYVTTCKRSGFFITSAIKRLEYTSLCKHSKRRILSLLHTIQCVYHCTISNAHDTICVSLYHPYCTRYNMYITAPSLLDTIQCVYHRIESEVFSPFSYTGTNLFSVSTVLF